MLIFPTDWKRRSNSPYLKRQIRSTQGTTGPGQSHLSAWKSHGACHSFHLETVLRHMLSKQIIDEIHHQFTKSKLCLTNFFYFYDWVTVLADDKRVTWTCARYLTVHYLTSFSLHWRGW